MPPTQIKNSACIIVGISEEIVSVNLVKCHHSMRGDFIGVIAR